MGFLLRWLVLRQIESSRRPGAWLTVMETVKRMNGLCRCSVVLQTRPSLELETWAPEKPLLQGYRKPPVPRSPPPCPWVGRRTQASHLQLSPSVKPTPLPIAPVALPALRFPTECAMPLSVGMTMTQHVGKGAQTALAGHSFRQWTTEEQLPAVTACPSALVGQPQVWPHWPALVHPPSATARPPVARLCGLLPLLLLPSCRQTPLIKVLGALPSSQNQACHWHKTVPGGEQATADAPADDGWGGMHGTRTHHQQWPCSIRRGTSSGATLLAEQRGRW